MHISKIFLQLFDHFGLLFDCCGLLFDCCGLLLDCFVLLLDHCGLLLDCFGLLFDFFGILSTLLHILSVGSITGVVVFGKLRTLVFSGTRFILLIVSHTLFFGASSAALKTVVFGFTIATGDATLGMGKLANWICAVLSP